MGYLKMCPYKNKDLEELGLFHLIEMQPSDSSVIIFIVFIQVLFVYF